MKTPWKFLTAALVVLIAAAAAFPVPARAASYEEFITLYWKGHGKGNAYVVQIKKGGDVVSEQKVKEMTLTVKLSPGKYEYRIKTVDQSNNEGPWSDSRTFEVGSGPIPISKDAFKFGPKGMSLAWEEVKGATGYRVKIWKDGQPHTETIVTDTNYLADLKETGRYRFAIAAMHDGIAGDVEAEYEYTVTDGTLVESQMTEEGIDVHPISLVELILEHNMPPKFHWSLGVATSYLTYSEELDDVKLSELAISAKVNANYNLIPGKLDLAANAFVTLATLMSSPATLSPAKFFGLNARLGYRLPFESHEVEWNVLTGWYIWNMYTGGEYGIRQLAGPQLFILCKLNELRASVYVKFAPISDQIGKLNMSNREIAIGGGYKLSVPDTYGPWGTWGAWMLTFDLSTTKFASDTAGNKMSLTTISLGIALGL